jgi:hypothetical protein
MIAAKIRQEHLWRVGVHALADLLVHCVADGEAAAHRLSYFPVVIASGDRGSTKQWGSARRTLERRPAARTLLILASQAAAPHLPYAVRTNAPGVCSRTTFGLEQRDVESGPRAAECAERRLSLRV